MKKIFTILGIVALSVGINAQELLVNPGFEAGLAPWAAGTTGSYTAPAIVTNDAHSGTNSAAYVGVTATTGFFQNVPVVGGQSYTISFWYKSSGDGTDSRLWSVYKNASNGAVYTTADATTDEFRTNNGYLPDAAVWTKHTATMPAHADATQLDVAVRVYNNGTAYFDDFSAAITGSLGVMDVKTFDKEVVMNTLVNDGITFRLPMRSTVNIYTMEGRLVSSDRVSDGQTLEASHLNSGYYIVIVDNGTAKISRKILKK
ncbi:MAG: hypothetical protein ABS44_04690 [Chryseobacterium sp. SCN 40-13]|nr:MAG: hypothetical protein ABS44_04690 [Chryseobacterium sp. SCN 40-13]